MMQHTVGGEMNSCRELCAVDSQWIRMEVLIEASDAILRRQEQTMACVQAVEAFQHACDSLKQAGRR